MNLIATYPKLVPTRMLTINPADEYYAMSGLQNYVVGTNSSAQIRIINDEIPEIDMASHGVTMTLAEIFHDANDDDSGTDWALLWKENDYKLTYRLF